MTLNWGLVFVGEATLRIALSSVVEPGMLVTASPILAPATFGPLGLWTLSRTRQQQPGPVAA